MSTDLSPLMAGLGLNSPDERPAGQGGQSLTGQLGDALQGATLPARDDHASSTPSMPTEHGPARQPTSLPSGAQGSQLDVIERLIDEVHRIQDRVYEIQELRHTSTQGAQLDVHLSALDANISDLSVRIDASLSSLVSGEQGDDVSGLRSDLQGEWAKVLSARAVLREEVKEDGWLVRFRATADQAEAMMLPLQNSLKECQSYLASASHSGLYSGPHRDPQKSLDLDRLRSLAKAHETMKSSYVPSVVKVLKMMEKSLASRTTRNGETLRRHAELCARWHKTQASLIELESQIDFILSGDGAGGSPYPGGVPASPGGSPLSKAGFAGWTHGMPRSGLSSGHRSSVSSASIASGSSSSQHASMVSPPPSYGPLAGRNAVANGRTPSTTSDSRAPHERSGPGSTGEARHHTAVTPKAGHRQSSFGYLTSEANQLASPSPSRSPRPAEPQGTTPSRIPIRSMRSVSDLQRSAQTWNPAASTSGASRTASDSYRPKTPTTGARPARMSLGAVRTPSSGARSFSASGGGPSPAPRPRQSLPRAPPSSYRSVSPIPPVPALPRGLSASTSSLGVAPRAPPSRPSSRLSTSSAVPWSREHGVADLTPFHPSPYDPLDQRVQHILDATVWEEFVARVDPSLKRGQRKGENEECKGEFVFRAGERPVGVKMLRIARGKDIKEKVLVRTGGMWVDLEGWLRKRQEESLGIFG